MCCLCHRGRRQPFRSEHRTTPAQEQCCRSGPGGVGCACRLAGGERDGWSGSAADGGRVVAPPDKSRPESVQLASCSLLHQLQYTASGCATAPIQNARSNTRAKGGPAAQLLAPHTPAHRTDACRAPQATSCLRNPSPAPAGGTHLQPCLDQLSRAGQPRSHPAAQRPGRHLEANARCARPCARSPSSPAAARPAVL